MKQKILLLEDNAYMNNALTELLEDNNYEVYEATTVSEAKSYFKKGVDFLIVDLNVSPEGLTETEKNMTGGLILSGWIWLRNYVFKEQPEYLRKTIIYSAYALTLKEKYPDEIKGVKLIDKGTEELNRVIEILKIIK